MTDKLAIKLPEQCQPYYTIDIAGRVTVYGEPPQAVFEMAWTTLCQVHDSIGIALGNMLAHAVSAWGETYTDKLIQQSGRKYGTLAQYKSVMQRIPASVQRPGVKYSYYRLIPALPHATQAALLDKLQAGDFDDPDEDPPVRERWDRFKAAVDKIKHRPPPTPPKPIPCPFCEGNGWARSKLRRAECPKCGAHGDEILEHYAKLLAAVQAFYDTGDRAALDEYVARYCL